MVALIFYDIEDNKQRTKVSKFLEKEGFERIQYSVFAGPTDTQELKELLVELYNKVTGKEDKIFALPISIAKFTDMLCCGPKPDLEYIAGTLPVLLIDWFLVKKS